ncbi:MAG: hypothetical protein K0S68_1123 [Candidatus Saccharibacteria bacterium]|jgi:drug/metabolite transporter (DMT)-like permease|nr:hypothetical protein [Candidatus Saccharibacteria bacterium]
MIYVIIATIFYSIAIILVSAAARNLNTNVSAGLANTISAIIPLAVAAPYLTKQTLQDHRLGVGLALLAGISIAIFTMASSKAYSLNKVAVVAPVVLGGSIFLSAILAMLIYKEKSSPMETLGLAVLGLGLLIIIYARATAK